MTEENIDKIIRANNQFKQNSESILRKATSQNGAVRREIEQAARKHNKTLDEIINSTTKSIESIDNVNTTYLTNLKETIMNR